MKMKTLGILGGMGPKATAVLYDRIVDHTDAPSDQKHVNTSVLSDTGIPDRTAAIISGDTEPVRDALISVAKKLDAAGADVIIMPCNTAHYFIEDIRSAVSCNVIDMISAAVCDAIKAAGTTEPRIGIMATDGTLATGVYEDEIVRQGASFAELSETAQAGIMSLIYDDIKAGGAADKSKFEAAYSELFGKCDAVILACTELSVYKEMHDVPPNCIDAMDSLVREAVLACGAKYRE